MAELARRAKGAGPFRVEVGADGSRPPGQLAPLQESPLATRRRPPSLGGKAGQERWGFRAGSGGVRNAVADGAGGQGAGSPGEKSREQVSVQF